MHKKRIVKTVLILAIVLIVILSIIYYKAFKSSTETGGTTVEGYVKQIYPEYGSILICYDPENTNDEEYMGDCYIYVEEDTVISDGRTFESIQPGEHLFATCTGTLMESFPAQIYGAVFIQMVD